MLCYFFLYGLLWGVGIMGEATGEWRRDMQQLYTLVCSFFVVAVSVISMVAFLSNKKVSSRYSDFGFYSQSHWLCTSMEQYLEPMVCK